MTRHQFRTSAARRGAPMPQARTVPGGFRGVRQRGRLGLVARPRRSPSLVRIVASTPPSDGQDIAVPANTPLTDGQVPEGHRALHAALYEDDKGDKGQTIDASVTAHASRRPYQFIAGEDDGTAILPIGPFLARRALSSDTLPPMGVFAIYDGNRTLQYVSYSRNIVLSVRSLVDSVDGGDSERCSYVRALVFQNRAMQTRQAMESQKQAWIEENGTLPPGNGVEKAAWEVGFSVGSMCEGEKELYDEKKTKMVAAMGQRLEEDEKMGSRATLKTAVEGGDWSAVVDEQTQGTIDANTDGTNAVEDERSKPMTTPFAQASVHRTMREHDGDTIMNMETVDKALDEVRPYLQADGGDVEVVEVENGRVLLRLQGQCSSCTASDSTMSMGIERALRANFGDQLKEVIELGGGAATVATSLGTVNAAVSGLRGAIEAYGGTVEVDTVDPPHAVILYTGVKSLAYGLKMALMDQFKDLKQITFVDGETGDVIEF